VRYGKDYRNSVETLGSKSRDRSNAKMLATSEGIFPKKDDLLVTIPVATDPPANDNRTELHAKAASSSGSQLSSS
jgi:hypothetical protein